MHVLFNLYAQLLAASLSSLLSGLDVHEDVFSMGQLSSLVAAQLGGLAETQARRKVSYLVAVCNVCLSNGSMDAGSDHGSTANGSVINLEVAGSGPVGCCFFFHSLLFDLV